MIYKNFILENSTIKKAILLLNKRKIKTLIVVDRNQKLLGSITDGDLRRGILKNSLNSPIKKIYNKNAIYIDHKQKLGPKIIKSMFNRNKINIIPVVNSSKKLLKFFTWISIEK